MIASLRRAHGSAPTPHGRSHTLASDQLDVMADKGAARADIEQRKDSLLHGPAEFREIRSDQNAKKPRFGKSAEQRQASTVPTGQILESDEEYKA